MMANESRDRTERFDSIAQGDFQTNTKVSELATGDTVLSMPFGQEQALQAQQRLSNDPKDVKVSELYTASNAAERDLGRLIPDTPATDRTRTRETEIF
jgi:hypothetical protein